MAGDLPPAPPPPSKPGAPAAKVFNCPACGSPLTLRAQGLTVSVVCRACGALIDAANENFQVLAYHASKIKIEPLIPIGQRALFRGSNWEVIGFMERSDETGVYTWREYLLFNPTRGFRWLTEMDGHWNFVVTTKEKPLIFDSADSETASWHNKSYKIFTRGKGKVTFVLGEFYWRVKVGETVDLVDYVNPPEMLSSEKSDNEVIWSLGEYVDAEEIRRYFRVTKPMPYRSNVAPNQPSALAANANSIIMAWILFVSLLCVMQFMAMARSSNESVYRESYMYKAAATDGQINTPQFQLNGGLTNVDLIFRAPVQNNWIEFEGDLVNDQTGETYEFGQGVEYYSGYDSDGYWSEGSQSNDAVLSAIPAGSYHINMHATGPSSGAWATGGSPMSEQLYSLEVKRDVVTWSNFFWALALISIFPLFIWWRNRSFEMARWSNSDYSPYASQHGDDD